MAASTGAIKAGRAYVEIFADSARLAAGLKSAEANVKKFADRVTAVGTSFTTVGLAAATPMALAVQTFAGFDDQMRAVQAVSGSTGEAFVGLTEKAKELGRTTSFTAAQVAEGMLSLGRAGFKSLEIDASIASVMNLSRATQTEIPLATDIAGNALRAFELDATEMERVCDVLTATANGSAQTLEDLGEAMKYVAPIARKTGMTIEDTAKVVGSLANFGIKGSMAGTVVKNIRTRMADADVQKVYKERLGIDTIDQDTGNLRNLADVLRDVGKATEEMPNGEKLSLFKSLFDMRAMAGGATLTNANFDALFDAIDNAAGTAQRTAEEMDKGIGGKFRLTASAIEGVAIKLGESLLPEIIKYCDILQNASASTVEWIAENKETVTSVAKFAAGILGVGGSLLAFGYAIRAVGGALTGLRAGFTATIAVWDALSGSSRRATELAAATQATTEAEIAVKAKKANFDRAEIAIKESLTIATQANNAATQASVALVQAQTAATSAGVATAQEAALVGGLAAKQKNQELAATIAATKARLLEAQAMKSQAAYDAAVAAGADATTLKTLKNEASKAAAKSATARVDAESAAALVAATRAEIAALHADIAARGEAANAAILEAEAKLRAAEAAAAAAGADLNAANAAASAAAAELQDARATLADASAKKKLAVAAGTATASMTAFAKSNAPLLVIGAIAYGVKRYASAASLAADAADDAVEKMRGQQAASATLRDEHQKLFDKIVELQNKQNLTNAEFNEGCKAVYALRNFYGDLGIEIDNVTKSFDGATEAAAKFAEKQRNLRLGEIDRLDQELAHQNDALKKDYEELVGSSADDKMGFKELWRGYLALLPFTEDVQSKAVEINDKRNSISKERDKLAGEKQDLINKSKAAQKDADETDKKTKKKQSISDEELEKAKKASESVGDEFGNSLLPEYAQRRIDAEKKYNEYKDNQDKIRKAALEKNPFDFKAVAAYAVNMGKAQLWKTGELKKAQDEEDKTKADAKAKADERKKNEDERNRNKELNEARVNEVQANLTYSEALRTGQDVGAAKANYDAAVKSRKEAEKNVARKTAQEAMTEYVDAIKALEEAQKSGIDEDVEAAEKRVDAATTDLGAANSSLESLVKGAKESFKSPVLSSSGTFNAFEAADFTFDATLKEMRRQTTILDDIKTAVEDGGIENGEGDWI